MDEIQINSIVDINTNILNPKRGNTQAELKKGAAYNKKECAAYLFVYGVYQLLSKITIVLKATKNILSLSFFVNHLNYLFNL